MVSVDEFISGLTYQVVKNGVQPSAADSTPLHGAVVLVPASSAAVLLSRGPLLAHKIKLAAGLSSAFYPRYSTDDVP